MRSAVLDSILIMCWLAEPEFISAIATESLVRVSKIKDEGENVNKIKERWKNFSEYYNAHNLPSKDIKVSVDSVLGKLPDSRNLKDYKHVYEYYSKYDHFSLLPYILTKTRFGYMAIMIMATHLIKHAFCGMASIHIPEQSAIFQDLLGVKMIKEKDGFLRFDTTSGG